MLVELVENQNNFFNPKFKNTLKATWQPKSIIEPESRDLDFQIAEVVYLKTFKKLGKSLHFLIILSIMR